MLCYKANITAKMTLPMMAVLNMLLTTGCSNDIHDHPDLVTGEQLFDHHCSECHNKTGAGVFLLGVPANRDTTLSSSQVIHKIQHNEKNSSKMPAFPEMSTEEAKKITDYLKQL